MKSEAEDKPEPQEPPEPADCAQGKYKIAVTFTCTCGEVVGLTQPELVGAAMNNAGLRIRHDKCRQWWFLTPETQVQIKHMGGGPNRRERRADAALKRTKGGLLVPR